MFNRVRKSNCLIHYPLSPLFLILYEVLIDGVDDALVLVRENNACNANAIRRGSFVVFQF
jgi:hypothetical protein